MRIDHLMWRAADLGDAVADMEQRLGRRVFIGWGSCRHPSAGLEPAGRLARLTAGTPDAPALRELRHELGMDVIVEAAPIPFLRAEIASEGHVVGLDSAPQTLGLRFG